MERLRVKGKKKRFEMVLTIRTITYHLSKKGTRPQNSLWVKKGSRMGKIAS